MDNFTDLIEIFYIKYNELKFWYDMQDDEMRLALKTLVILVIIFILLIIFGH